MRPILIGILGAFFFSLTFIFNRSMELAGGSWIWSGSLRFFYAALLLLLIVGFLKRITPVFQHLKKHPWQWLIWSTVGFGFFYAPLTFATVYAPGWLVAATFQLSIVAGSLLVPFINKANNKIPLSSVFVSIIIVIGVFVMQIEHAGNVSYKAVVLTVVPLIISSIAYPLGNRKMMHLVGDDLGTLQRLLGMTIASMPFWIILSIFGFSLHGAPSLNQHVQTFLLAILVGIIATLLFFYATELVRNDNHKLAGVEATTATEIIFALAGEIIFLNAMFPNIVSIFGIMLVIAGIIMHSIISGMIDKRRFLREV